MPKIDIYAILMQDQTGSSFLQMTQAPSLAEAQQKVREDLIKSQGSSVGQKMAFQMASHASLEYGEVEKEKAPPTPNKEQARLLLRYIADTYFDEFDKGALIDLADKLA